MTCYICSTSVSLARKVKIGKRAEVFMCPPCDGRFVAPAKKLVFEREVTQPSFILPDYEPSEDLMLTEDEDKDRNLPILYPPYRRRVYP